VDQSRCSASHAPAGPYLFRLADPNSSANVEQVLNEDGSNLFGLFLSISAERFEEMVRYDHRDAQETV
jgi:hypothetical protein